MVENCTILANIYIDSKSSKKYIEPQQDKLKEITCSDTL